MDMELLFGLTNGLIRSRPTLASVELIALSAVVVIWCVAISLLAAGIAATLKHACAASAAARVDKVLIEMQQQIPQLQNQPFDPAELSLAFIPGHTKFSGEECDGMAEGSRTSLAGGGSAVCDTKCVKWLVGFPGSSN